MGSARPAALAALILIWGTTWAVIRVGLDGVPPLTGVALRFALAGAVLAAAARLAGVPLAGDPRLPRLWGINTLFTFSIPYGVTYWAEQWLPSGLAALLFSSYPLFVAGLAHLWLPKERLRAPTALGLLVGFGGVAVIYSEDLSALGGPQVVLAAAVFLLTPAASAVGSVLIKRDAEGVRSLTLTAPPMLFTAALFGGLALVFERAREVRFDSVSVGAILYLALLGSAVTFGLYFWLLARLPATRLSLITFCVPLVAVLVGMQFLDEPITPRIAAGAALVLAGVWFTLRTPVKG